MGPQLGKAGLPSVDLASMTSVRTRAIASLWGGMGKVYEMKVTCSGGVEFVIIAKRVKLPSTCLGVGDQRKKDSYEVEAAFYGGGHAERLIQEGCAVPFPLLVESSRGDGLTICMTKLQGQPCSIDERRGLAVMGWLARLHATFWGPRADEAVSSGLQAQGCYWYLDTRLEELESMPRRGWEGRLRLAARAIDERLKADPMQTVCHGDAKGANIIFANQGGGPVALFYDFQYCGKAPPTKDLAYMLTCASDSARSEPKLLEFYHRELSVLLEAQGDAPPSLETIKSSLELSICDLGRWMSGWGWWGHAIDERIKMVLDRLDGGRGLSSEAAYVEAVGRVFPVE